MSLIARLVLIIALAVAGEAPAQAPCPELAFYALVPFTYPFPIHPRVCRTEYGNCRLPWGVQPRTPCSCQAVNGAWLPGVCLR